MRSESEMIAPNFPLVVAMLCVVEWYRVGKPEAPSGPHNERRRDGVKFWNELAKQ